MNVADAVPPATVAVAVHEPVLLFAVSAGALAFPDPSVVDVPPPPKVPDDPLAPVEADHETVTPDPTAFALMSVTRTDSGVANAVFICAD